MEYDIVKLHNELVEILDYVVDVCEKNGFEYCLLYGTALGAYRHRGFIPWDDDLDIGMPREDYEKFIEYIKKNPSNLFSLQDESNEKNWFLTFCKVRKNDTLFIESMSDGLYSNNGVFIDIFPLDYIKKNTGVFSLKRTCVNYFKHVLRIQACPNFFLEKEGKIKYIFDRILSFPSYLFSNKKLIHCVNRLMISKMDESEMSFVVQYDESSQAAVMEKKIYLPFKQCEFEGKYYNVPNDIQEYLRRQYGDNYMQLPPVEQRMTHKPLKIKL